VERKGGYGGELLKPSLLTATGAGCWGRAERGGKKKEEGGRERHEQEYTLMKNLSYSIGIGFGSGTTSTPTPSTTAPSFWHGDTHTPTRTTPTYAYIHADSRTYYHSLHQSLFPSLSPSISLLSNFLYTRTRLGLVRPQIHIQVMTPHA
jgi:hypothetical protein